MGVVGRRKFTPTEPEGEVNGDSPGVEPSAPGGAVTVVKVYNTDSWTSSLHILNPKVFGSFKKGQLKNKKWVLSPTTRLPLFKTC